MSGAAYQRPYICVRVDVHYIDRQIGIRVSQKVAERRFVPSADDHRYDVRTKSVLYESTQCRLLLAQGSTRSQISDIDSLLEHVLMPLADAGVRRHPIQYAAYLVGSVRRSDPTTIDADSVIDRKARNGDPHLFAVVRRERNKAPYPSIVC